MQQAQSPSELLQHGVSTDSSTRLRRRHDPLGRLQPQPHGFTMEGRRSTANEQCHLHCSTCEQQTLFRSHLPESGAFSVGSNELKSCNSLLLLPCTHVGRAVLVPANGDTINVGRGTNTHITNLHISRVQITLKLTVLDPEGRRSLVMTNRGKNSCRVLSPRRLAQARVSSGTTCRLLPGDVIELQYDQQGSHAFAVVEAPFDGSPRLRSMPLGSKAPAESLPGTLDPFASQDGGEISRGNQLEDTYTAIVRQSVSFLNPMVEGQLSSSLASVEKLLLSTSSMSYGLRNILLGQSKVNSLPSQLPRSNSSQQGYEPVSRLEEVNLLSNEQVARSIDVILRSVHKAVDASHSSTRSLDSATYTTGKRKAENRPESVDPYVALDPKRRRTGQNSKFARKSSHISCLPPEVLRTVFSFLNFHEAVRCSRTCHSWYSGTFSSSSHKEVDLSQYFAGTLTPNYDIFMKICKRINPQLRTLSLANCKWVCTGDILCLLGLPVGASFRGSQGRANGEAETQRLRYLEYFVAITTGKVLPRMTGRQISQETDGDSTESDGSSGTSDVAEGSRRTRRGRALRASHRREPRADRDYGNYSNLPVSGHTLAREEEAIQYRNAMMTVRHNASQPNTCRYDEACKLRGVLDRNIRSYGEGAKRALLEFKREADVERTHGVPEGVDVSIPETEEVKQQYLFLKKMCELSPSGRGAAYASVLEEGGTLGYRYVSPATDLLFPWYAMAELERAERISRVLSSELELSASSRSSAMRRTGCSWMKADDIVPDTCDNHTCVSHFLPIPAPKPTPPVGSVGSGFRRVPEQMPAYFASSVEALDLEGCHLLHLSNIPLLLCYCPQLRRLSLKSCNQLSERSLICAVRMLGSIESLNLEYLQAVSDDVLRTIGSCCPNLKEICLAGCQDITDDGVEALLKGCSGIRKLGARGCQELTNRTLYNLAADCPHLVVANLSGISSFTAYGLSALVTECLTLREVRIDMWHYQQPPEIQQNDPRPGSTEDTSGEVPTQRRSYRSMPSLKNALSYLKAVIPEEDNRRAKILTLKGEVDLRSSHGGTKHHRVLSSSV
eukprot:gb/GECG01010865.1/.p1 GENE.gb/GECG01010865.1/~~gb/GECG01010865.1/.p1  ORF type:complete len:1069 (+),score=76.54 gb/GECG01010865.1/:1-3207(+)